MIRALGILVSVQALKLYDDDETRPPESGDQWPTFSLVDEQAIRFEIPEHLRNCLDRDHDGPPRHPGRDDRAGRGLKQAATVRGGHYPR